MKILSIDPGYGRAGFSVIEKTGTNLFLLESSCLETSTKDTFSKRLSQVINVLEEYIKKYSPEHIVLEKVFFAKNKKTALQIAEVRGACIQATSMHNIPYFEYTPNEIKLAVVGNGAAKKEDIIFMVPKLIKITKQDKMLDDEYDAIAAGLTHAAMIRNIK